MAITGGFNPYVTYGGSTYTGSGTGGLVGGGGGGVGTVGTTWTASGGYLINPPFAPLYPGTGKAPLTPGQLAQLLRDHTFIPMDGNLFCLLCFALDHYRYEGDHIFVIHEE